MGGKHKVPMADLRSVFEQAGFGDVTTLLNTGNVVFSADSQDIHSLQTACESLLEKKFGWHIPVLLRTQEWLQKIERDDPFKNIEITPHTRLYVTFLPDDVGSNVSLPYTSENGLFRILKHVDGALFSVLVLSQEGDSLKLMDIIGKEYGTNVTTRNWNTVKKLAAL